MFISFIFLLSRMVEFGWISDSIWARPQEADSLRHPNPKYRWETLCCPGRRYRDYFAPSVHSLPGRTWRPQAGFRRWLYYVVCQLVAIMMGWSRDLYWNQTGVEHIAMGWKVPFKNACIIFIIFIIFVIWVTITNNENNENNWMWKRKK